MWLFFALIAVPVIEIALFIELGDVLGLWPTLGMIFLTAAIGVALMRAQGFAAMRRLQAAMAEGSDPRGPLAEGAMILFAGALMLTPGFFTDTMGFLLLLPPVRAALAAWVAPRLAARTLHARANHAGGSARRSQPDAPIEVEYEEIDAGDDSPRSEGGRSGWSNPPR